MPDLTTGDHVPNFALPDQEGRMWMLAERLKDGPVILVFYRGDW
ncbi:MAG: redoxin domain-containing protein [Chloroflexota bacterium]|nr:redoxin domain-containing protein [Chloroflexota bacterium]